MVEIIPKLEKEVPLWQNILLYFSLALLIGMLSFLFVLNKEKTKSSQNLDNLEKTLIQEKTSEERALEKNVLETKEKINNFSFLFENRKFSSFLFPFLEKNCHPEVFFSRFSLNVPEKKLTLAGKSKSFLSLEQQLFILRKENLIKEINLTELSLDKEGNVNFSLEISLSPKLFLQNL